MKKLLILLITVLMLLGITVAVSASTTLTGTLYYRLDNSNKIGGTENNSDVNFFRISVATNANFNDKSEADLTLQCQTYLPDACASNKTQNAFMWNIYTYGYTYYLTNRWDLGVTYSCEGVPLSDGTLATDWQWHHISAFDSKNAIKLVGSPFDFLNLGFYYSPPLNKTDSMVYLAKGQLTFNGFKLGGGYSNGASKKWDVYTEIVPFKNFRFYYENAQGEYLIQSSLGIGPLTANLTASSHSETYLNKYTIFWPNTADVSLSYALSGKKSITAGTAFNYYVMYPQAIYGKYDFNLGYVELKQDTGDVNKPETFLSDTHIKAGYRFDHTNLLEADYNATTGQWWTGLAVYFN